jgi:23S rRNA (pseudouridine1915-N3)-methyltransferase
VARRWIVAWAGRHQRNEWEVLCAEYKRRIRGQLDFDELVIRPRVGGGRSRLEAEGTALLASLPQPCRLVALDRQGDALSSEGLAARLEAWRRQWPHPVAFLLGSDLGLAPAVLSRAELRLSLGAITLPHELARLVLLEQLYRALAIAGGSAYHRKRPGSLV